MVELVMVVIRPTPGSETEMTPPPEVAEFSLMVERLIVRVPSSLRMPPPSVREVGVEVGLRSSQTVHHHLRKLEEEGYVARESGARMVRLTEKG